VRLVRPDALDERLAEHKRVERAVEDGDWRHRRREPRLGRRRVERAVLDAQDAHVCNRERGVSVSEAALTMIERERGGRRRDAQSAREQGRPGQQDCSGRGARSTRASQGEEGRRRTEKLLGAVGDSDGPEELGDLALEPANALEGQLERSWRARASRSSQTRPEGGPRGRGRAKKLTSCGRGTRRRTRRRARRGGRRATTAATAGTGS